MNENEPPTDIPAALRASLDGAEWQGVTVGMSGARVWRVTTRGNEPRYLKWATGARARELGEERARLEWLRGRLAVPAMEGWAEGAEQAWLLLSAEPGVMAHEWASQAQDRDDMAALVRALGEGLRRVHALDIAGCPFDLGRDARLSRAEWNIAAGLVDVADVRASHGLEPEELLRALDATRPMEPSSDLVFTHGDYCLPNLLITMDERAAPLVTSYIDWGRAGISDRYNDLAIGARSLRYNLGTGWESLFFIAYGLSEPDQERLAWYEALDELS
jgi:aminoglycoside phosphotransferase